MIKIVEITRISGCRVRVIYNVGGRPSNQNAYARGSKAGSKREILANGDSRGRKGVKAYAAAGWSQLLSRGPGYVRGSHMAGNPA